MNELLKKVKARILNEQRKTRIASNDTDYNFHRGKVEAYKEIKEYLLELEKGEQNGN